MQDSCWIGRGDGRRDFDGLLINLKWIDRETDHRASTSKLIVCSDRVNIFRLQIYYRPTDLHTSVLQWTDESGKRRKVRDGYIEEREKKREGYLSATPLLQTQPTLSSHLPRFPHGNFPPSGHPVQALFVPRILLFPLAYASKAPLNSTHRTNGLLYASAYMRTIPFYRDSPYLPRRYLLSDRLTSSSLFST